MKPARAATATPGKSCASLFTKPPAETVPEALGRPEESVSERLPAVIVIPAPARFPLSATAALAASAFAEAPAIARFNPLNATIEPAPVDADAPCNALVMAFANEAAKLAAAAPISAAFPGLLADGDNEPAELAATAPVKARTIASAKTPAAAVIEAPGSAMLSASAKLPAPLPAAAPFNPFASAAISVPAEA